MMKCNSCDYSDQSSFIWCLLFLCFVKDSIGEVMKLLPSMYEQKFDFSADFEGLLLRLWETRDITLIFEIAKAVVTQNLFDVERHIFIVASLVKLGKLSIADAAQFLKIDPVHNYADLDNRVKRVIDVAWLVAEDSKDRIMSPSDDSLLEKALQDATTLFDNV